MADERSPLLLKRPEVERAGDAEVAPETLLANHGVPQSPDFEERTILSNFDQASDPLGFTYPRFFTIIFNIVITNPTSTSAVNNRSSK